MSKVSCLILASVATACLGLSAVAQELTSNTALKDPLLKQSLASNSAPKLNQPVGPRLMALPPAAKEGRLLGSDVAVAPRGPGSGGSFAFALPSELSHSLTTAAVSTRIPQSGAFSTASSSGFDVEQEGVPPMLGVDVSMTDSAAFATSNPASADVKLGQ